MTVPESAAAVFERVLGEHAATSRSGAECACGWTGDRSSDIPYIEEFRAHVAAQLATGLCDDLSRSEGKLSELSDSGTESLTAQPDTLGDGGGVPVVRTDFASASEAMGALGDPLCPMPKTWVIVAEDFDSEAPLEYTPEAMEYVRSGTFFTEFQPDALLALTQPSATSERGGKDE